MGSRSGMSRGKTWIAAVAAHVLASCAFSLEILPETLPPGAEMTDYRFVLSAGGGDPPLAWEAAPETAAWGGQEVGLSVLPQGLAEVAALDGGLDFGVALHHDGSVTGWGSASGLVLRGVAALSAGDEHALFLLRDGSVAAWGENRNSQASPPPGLKAVAVAAGARHSLALREDGTVAAWGDGDYGQLAIPPGLTQVTALAAGGFHNLALRKDGTVAAWGYNGSGQASVPAGLDAVTALAAGDMHSLALKADGSVAAWGDNRYGQALPPPGLGPVKALAAGGDHSLALKADGSVAAWGSDGFGQASVPGALPAIGGISAGFYFSLALVEEGARLPRGLACSPEGVVAGVPVQAGSHAVRFAVRDASGNRASRFLNLSIAPHADRPPSIASFSPVSLAVTLGEWETRDFIILAEDPEGVGLAYRWTLDGEVVGTGDTEYRYTPGWGAAGCRRLRVDVSDGLWTNRGVEWTLFVVADADGDGLEDRWEHRYFGDCSPDGEGDADGDGRSDREEHDAGTDPRVPPVSLENGEWPAGREMTAYAFPVTALHGKPPFAWEAAAASSVVGWGGNWLGQASPPEGLDKTVALAAGSAFSLAVRRNGTVTGWGDNREGQTGGYPGLATVASVSAGLCHVLALHVNGFVTSWGGNTSGQRTVPAGLFNVAAVSAGWEHSLALRKDGTVVAWGSNGGGQSSVPAGLTGVKAVSAGAYHSLALRSNGTVVAWGSGAGGQLAVPDGLDGVTAIAAGAFHNLALRADGTVAAWGADEHGQSRVPAGLTGVVAVAAGGAHSLALRRDGTVAAWGSDEDGQISIPPGLGGVVAIAAGFHHSLALRDPGSGLPPGLTLSEDGVVSGLPLLAGAYDVKVSVRDAQSTKAEGWARIRIDPHPDGRPVVETASPEPGFIERKENESNLFSVQARDPEGQPLTYAWRWDGAVAGSNAPAHVVRMPYGTGGTHELECLISDGFWTNGTEVRWMVTLLDDNDRDGLSNVAELDLGRDPEEAGDGGAFSSVSGVIRMAGAGLGGARVELRGAGTNVYRRGLADAEGRYHIPGTEPGFYYIKVCADYAADRWYTNAGHRAWASALHVPQATAVAGVDLELRSGCSPALLQVTSEPAGASIFLNHHETGSVTPALLDAGEVGERDPWGSRLAPPVVAVRLPGRSWPAPRAVRASEAETVAAHFDLTPEAEGAVIVDTDPRGARVFLDDAQTPLGYSPQTVRGLAPGWHDLFVEKEGFLRPRPARVLVEAGVTNTVRVPLIASSESCNLEVRARSLPPRASIWADYRPCTSVTEAVLCDLDATWAEGAKWTATLHTVMVAHPGYRPSAPRYVDEGWNNTASLFIPLLPAGDMDADGDGLSDYWEQAYRLAEQAPDAHGAGDDADGDGVSNAAESAAGTDPLDPLSFFRIGAFEADENGRRLVFPTVPGRHYQILQAPAAGGPWSRTGGTLLAAGMETEARLPPAPAAAACFFKIVVLGL